MTESAVGHDAQLAMTPFAPHQRKRAIGALLVVTSVWGATFIWMKQALNELQPEIEAYGSNRVVGVLVAARFAIAALVMVIFFPKARAALRDKEQWKGGALLGGVMLVGFVTQMIGLDEINPAVSAFLTSLYVVFTALITILMTKSQPSRVLMFGVLLATFGAGFIQGPPHLTWGFGEVMTVVCAVFFALHIIYTQRITQVMDPVGVTQTSFAVVALGAVAMVLLLGGGRSIEEWRFIFADGVFIPVLCLGIGGSFFCLLLLNMYQRYLHPIQAAIIYALEPVWATTYGLGLGLVDWSTWILIGGGALFLGNIVVELFTHADSEE
ncbi:MAG: DMT family transporter [Euryarchaeota archaeon]|jgi:drug/metabolite transporter (DMT)-like permease|nr:MAG: permease of the drug/metabolite transporter (DMT) superfamily [uncultured Candidatus Poseidoniales archaeon]MBT3451821.1 DMT family transporter [Euryarchaeota archaeon]MDA8556183.1 DMT family transporter [Candidatus Poseidoniales archaeon]MDB0004732.1 DMT family transporter [Candidatus Poseidoniaceae archaeon]MDB2457715.1 DMT family transporter [bacterium]